MTADQVYREQQAALLARYTALEDIARRRGEALTRQIQCSVSGDELGARRCDRELRALAVEADRIE